MREVVWVTTALLALGAFGIGNAIGQIQRHRPSLSLEGLTGSPSAIVTPKGLSAVDASKGVPPGWTPGPSPQGQKMVLRYEPGGSVGEHWRRFNSYAIYQQQVEVRGLCYSACTIVMIAVPSDHICFGRDAALLFHLVQHGPGAQQGMPHMEASLDLYNRYPANIRAWIDSKGGMANMPHGGGNFWMLTTPELWAMGYRRCAD